MSAAAVDRTTLVRAAVVTALVVAICLAFVWSYVGALHQPRFHGVDVAVAGPDALARQLERGESLDVTAVRSRAEAIALIDERKAFGAVVADERRTEVLIASAAGTAVAQRLSESLPAALRSAGGEAAVVAVTDVKSLPRADSRGV